MQLKMSSNKKIHNIIYYDSTTRIAYSMSGNNIIPYVKKLDAKSKIISTFPFDALIKATIEVPKIIDEIDIPEFLSENVYKQLNIPSEASYEMSFFKIDLEFDADNWTYDVYLVDGKYLDKAYNELIDKTQFIDVVTSIPFLPLVLYKTGKLDTISNHIFIFIGDNGGVFAFYSKGEPVYMKILNSNSHKLRVEFNQESSLELNSLEFESFVAGKSSDINNYKSYMDSMLSKISRDIEENIMYIKRVYQGLEPTAIYYGMNIEYDPNFLSFFRDTFLIETKPFNSLSEITTQKGLFAVSNIAMTYASYLISNPNSNLPNFSHAKRPTPLSQRDSYQFIMAAVGLFTLSLLYPFYNFGMMGFYAIRGNMLQTSYDTEVLTKADQYRADEKALKDQIESLQNQKEDVNKQVLAIRGDMDDIHTWQVGYIQKSKILDDILKVAISSNVKVVKVTGISNNNQHFIIELNLFAKTQKNITDFIKILNEKNIYKNVYTDKIEKISIADGKNQENKSGINSLLNAANSAANAAKDVVSNLNNNASQTQSISAQVDLSGNQDLGRSVSGYLNSIVKVVVR